MGLSSALVGACLVCYALVGACLVCSALVGACLACSALVGACLVCSALVGACLVCSALVGACLVCSALVGACLVCSALVGACLVCSALEGACLVCSALVGACLVCSALAGACLVCSALAGACLVCSTLVGACLVCYALVGACVWIISFFQKSRQEKVVSVSGSQEGMESHGKINFGPHSSSLSPAESVIKGYSRTLCQIMEAGKRAPHTQTPPRSATGQVPAFHLAALPWVRRWSQWSRLYGVWVLGAAQPSRWLLRTIWLGYAIQFTRRPPKFRGIHLTAVKAADVLWEESLSYWRRTWWYRSLQPIWRQGFSALTSLCPRKAVGYDQSWVCASWTGPFINLLSRCSCRTTSSDASVPKFGLQHLTWNTRTSMCRSFRATGHSCGLRSKDEHISKGPALRAVPIAPCLHESSGGSPCSLERTGRAHSQLPRRLAHTGSVSGSVMRTQGFGALTPQPVGPSGQLGKEQTLADAEDLFSLYGVWIRSIRQRASRRNALSLCWTAWIRSRTGRRQHWNSFRGSWGILWLRRWSHRWGCSIWDRFNTGSMAESRGGRGRVARCGSKSLQPAAKPSPRGQTFHSFGQECPWNRSPGTLWFTRMPPPRTGGPRSTGL